jgi:hypothetical protein
MNKTFIQYPVSGYTPVEHVKLPSREQLELLRDALLEWGDLNAAAACDNLIDILWHVANTAENVEVVSNPLTNGSVRYPETKIIADAICEEYEAQDADWHAQVTELRGGI